MGHSDSCAKQVRNRILCILVAASAVSVLVYSFSQLSDGEETAENLRFWINISFRRSFQAVDSLAPSASALQNVSVTVNYGDKRSISPEIWHGNTLSEGRDGYEINGQRVNQSCENLISEKGSLKRYPDHVEEKNSSLEHQSQNMSEISVVADMKTQGKVYTMNMNENPPVQCDIYSGKWVRDDSYPLYPAGECPYMSGAFDCKGNGRTDSNYTQWRWQPRDCNLPRIITVPLSYFGHPSWLSKAAFKLGIKAKKYLGSTQLRNKGVTGKMLISSSSIQGIGGHMGIKLQRTRDFYQEGDYLHPEMDPLVAFEKGLTTWAKWIDHNMNPTKTRVFFRGFSPMHFSSEQWHRPGTHKCNFETEPILEESLVKPDPVMLQVVGKVLRHMKFPVTLLNITRVSDFRKDAHPSIYTRIKKEKLTKEQRDNPDEFGDCSHWCLPGVPDIWNELLYGSLVTDASATPSSRSPLL
eukprot:PITA_01022